MKSGFRLLCDGCDFKFYPLPNLFRESREHTLNSRLLAQNPLEITVTPSHARSTLMVWAFHCDGSDVTQA
jgi:hypothetical protein